MAKQTFASKTYAPKTFFCGTYQGGATGTGTPVRTFNLVAAQGTVLNLGAAVCTVFNLGAGQ